MHRASQKTLIADDLLNHFSESPNKLVVTSAAESPEQVQEGTHIIRRDMNTLHEEADVIIPQQIMHVMKEGHAIYKVITEDTDIFVLLCHFYFHQQWKIQLFMESFGTDASVICIKSSVERNISIMPSLLSAHAFGCDTVPAMSGIGKKTVLKTIKKQPLLTFGEINTTENEYISEGKRFVAACYSAKHESSSKNRKMLWEKRTGSAKLTANPVSLKSLPPTDPVLELNIRRARHTRMIWGASLEPNPPTLNPLEDGWYLDQETQSLRPIMMPKGAKAAPDEILKITRCGCNTSHCKTSACSCTSYSIPCPEFCGCNKNGCDNKWNKVISDSDEDYFNDHEDQFDDNESDSDHDEEQQYYLF